MVVIDDTMGLASAAKNWKTIGKKEGKGMLPMIMRLPWTWYRNRILINAMNLNLPQNQFFREGYRWK